MAISATQLKLFFAIVFAIFLDSTGQIFLRFRRTRVFCRYVLVPPCLRNSGGPAGNRCTVNVPGTGAIASQPLRMKSGPRFGERSVRASRHRLEGTRPEADDDLAARFRGGSEVRRHLLAGALDQWLVARSARGRAPQRHCQLCPRRDEWTLVTANTWAGLMPQRRDIMACGQSRGLWLAPLP
jgi:hypothetical protein